jgi:hypothetical protein
VKLNGNTKWRLETGSPGSRVALPFVTGLKVRRTGSFLLNKLRTILTRVIVLTNGEGAFVAVIPNQTIVVVAANAVIRTATSAIFATMTFGPALRRLGHRVNLGAGFFLLGIWETGLNIPVDGSRIRVV